MNLNNFFSDESCLLLAIAAPSEVTTVLHALKRQDLQAPGDWHTLHFSNFSILQTGVGKANAAGSVACELTLSQKKNRNYVAVLSFGIAGSLRTDVAIGSSVAGIEVVFADEGTPLVNSIPWTSLEDAGWAQTAFECANTEWLRYLVQNADFSGKIATVSTISGTDDIAVEYAKRTGALAESIEGAAVAQVCLRLGVPFSEYRIISNLCGNRDINKLDISTSFKRIAQTIQEWGLAGQSAC